jgi:hypothetical protein
MIGRDCSNHGELSNEYASVVRKYYNNKPFERYVISVVSSRPTVDISFPLKFKSL